MLVNAMADHPRGSVDRARRLVEQHHRSGAVSDAGSAKVEALLTSGTVVDRWQAAEIVEVTASPEYERAFWALLKDPRMGHVGLSDQERDALAKGRAMSIGIGAAGGAAVPFVLDPTVILTQAGSVNPLRRIARTVTGVGKSWEGVTSAGITSQWVPEGVEASDSSPTLAQPTITPVKQLTFVPFSIELDLSWTTAQQELAALMMDSADQTDALAMVSGNGTTQPQGVITGLAGTASEITTAAAGTLTLADLTGLQESVPPRFRPKSQWIGSLGGIHAAKKFQWVVNGESVVNGDHDPYSMAG
jgi:HK97 family phage major capsid protein